MLWFLLNNKTKQQVYCSLNSLLYPLLSTKPTSLWKKAQCRKTKWKSKIGQCFKEDAVLCRSISTSKLYHVYFVLSSSLAYFPGMRRMAHAAKCLSFEEIIFAVASGEIAMAESAPSYFHRSSQLTYVCTACSPPPNPIPKLWPLTYRNHDLHPFFKMPSRIAMSILPLCFWVW